MSGSEEYCGGGGGARGQGGRGLQTEALGGREARSSPSFSRRELSFPDASKKPRESFKTLNCAEAGDSGGGDGITLNDREQPTSTPIRPTRALSLCVYTFTQKQTMTDSSCTHGQLLLEPAWDLVKSDKTKTTSPSFSPAHPNHPSLAQRTHEQACSPPQSKRAH